MKVFRVIKHYTQKTHHLNDEFKTFKHTKIIKVVWEHCNVKAIEIIQTSKHYAGIFKSSPLLQPGCQRDPGKSSPAAHPVKAKAQSLSGCWLPAAAGRWWQEVEVTWDTIWDVPLSAQELLLCSLTFANPNGKFHAERIFSRCVGVPCLMLITKAAS